MQATAQVPDQAFVIKRIHRDIQELQNEAIPWVSICIPDPQQPFLLRGNIMIQDGPYKDVLIPLIIRLPSSYPLSAPAANIVPGHPFTWEFHEHVFPNEEYGSSICTDLLSNFRWFFKRFEISGKPVVSGWTPVYTISSILMQLQIFFADPDMPSSYRPTNQDIQTMKKKVRSFTMKIEIKDEDGIAKTVVHSYDAPYPPFVHDIPLSDEQKSKKQAESIRVKESVREEHKSVALADGKKLQDDYSMVLAKSVTSKEFIFEVRNKLVCPVTKYTILNDPIPLFGYPILINTDEFDRLWPTPVIEIISKEGMEYYIKQPAQALYFKNNGKYTSVFGQEYNYWLPLYINQKHFAQVKEKIFGTIKDIYQQMSPEEDIKAFSPEMVLKVLPPILVKTVIHMLKGDLHQSLAALDAYCQFYWLFMNLVHMYPELQEKINEEAEKFLHEEDFRHKRKVGDLGEFMYKLSLSKYSIYNKEINEALLGEFLTRQVSWAKGRDKNLRKEEIVNLVKRFMKATTVACQFFLIQFETTKLMVNDIVRTQLEEGYGVVNPAMLDRFMKKMNWIRKNMNDDWRVLIKNIGLEDIVTSEEKMKEILLAAFDDEEVTYSKWSALKCSITGIDHQDPSHPLFGYTLRTYPSVVLDSSLVCKEAADSRGAQWLPLYLNKEHFERAKSIYNAHLLSIYKSMTISAKEKERNGFDISKIAVKVFCHILASCLDKLSILRKLQMNMLRAILQLVWTFWKLLEQNAKMRELLDQEVKLFSTDEYYRKSMSWFELRECVIKLILSEKGRDSLELWNLILEELVSKEAKSAVGNIYWHDPQGFDCQKFGKFNQEAIKLFLLQVLLTKIVLKDKYRAQFEHKSGTLRNYEVDNLRKEVVDVLKERYYHLWKPTLEVLELKDLFKGANEMSVLTKKMYRVAVQTEKEEEWAETKKKREEAAKLLLNTSNGNTKTALQAVGSLGLKFAVKVDKKTPKSKEKGN